MTPIQRQLLDAVQLAPGEWTADEHAEDLGLSLSDAREAARRLVDSGHVYPRGTVALSPATRRRIEAGGTFRASVPIIEIGRRGWASAEATIRVLWECGPLSAQELARRTGHATVPGGQKRRLRALRKWGVTVGGQGLLPR